MLSSLVAISGMLAAAPGGAARPARVDAVEVSFVTHAGEGAAGVKRLTRDGCYQTESGGSTGGAGYARDGEAGCHLPAAVAPTFARLDAVGAEALVREKASGAGPARGAARPSTASASDTEIVLLRSDGSRWKAATRATADDILRAINELPSENQWHAQPPDKPVGTGPQLVVLSVLHERTASVRFQAALASDGRWWCHRTVIGDRADEPRLPVKSLPPLRDAADRLARILAGAGSKATTAQRVDDPVSVEVVWPGQSRRSLNPASLADAAASRFSAEMNTFSAACALAPGYKR